MAKHGYQCSFYYDDDPIGALESADDKTFSELATVKDLTLNDEFEEVDETTRANNGYKATAPGLRDNGVDTEIEWDVTNAGFAALYTAFKTKAAIAMAIMDGDIEEVGTHNGVAGNFKVISFVRNEPVGGHVTASVTIKGYSMMEDWTVVVEPGP